MAWDPAQHEKRYSMIKSTAKYMLKNIFDLTSIGINEYDEMDINSNVIYWFKEKPCHLKPIVLQLKIARLEQFYMVYMMGIVNIKQICSNWNNHEVKTEYTFRPENLSFNSLIWSWTWGTSSALMKRSESIPIGNWQ